ncbi:AIPR family protein [Enterococcus larvae]|uniref:AIPR family protein n=1 Tax=Enterococcus larvae TaxID=2794352 RepID=UPI003F3D71B3
MNQLMNLEEMLEENIGLNISASVILDENIYMIEGTTDKNGNDESFIIVDCSVTDEIFDLKKYVVAREQNTNFSSLIILFRDWDHERKLFNNTIKGLGREDKKSLQEIFKSKISYYTNIVDNMVLSVSDSGVNYLEYSNFKQTNEVIENELTGYVYNISFAELKKVFNVTGSNLFNMNVRYGLNKDRTGIKLKDSFKSYVKMKCLSDFKNEDKVFEELCRLFEIDEYSSEYHVPENFWFYHNGITIFSYDNKSIDRTGKTLVINPRKVSVINGAQTLTQFFLGLEELSLDIDSISGNIEGIDDSQRKHIGKRLIDSIDRAAKEIFVKTIFIEGEEKQVKEITSGLNTQIPILDEDQLADSEKIKEINKRLKKIQVKVLKAGESPGGYKGVKVLEFIKLYLIVKYQPGKSKNFQKAQLSEVTENIHSELFSNSKNSEELLDGLEKAITIDEWWGERPREGKENHIEIDSYGKNYFQSFALRESSKAQEDIDSDLLLILYKDFIDIFNSKDLNVGTFKKDDLFNEYLEGKLIFREKYKELNEQIILSDLSNFLNNNINNKYSVKNTILKYFESNSISVEYFRVVPIKNGRVKEAFPLPNSTFNELYQWEGYPVGEEYKEFADSKLCKELNRVYPIFIIYWSEDNENIEKVQLISDFSFNVFLKQAKEVYNKTVKAFKEGNKSLFPKISDDLHFHIRPKAMNSKDMFEFSDGEWITKRTFWANASTIEEIIEKFTQKN